MYVYVYIYHVHIHIYVDCEICDRDFTLRAISTKSTFSHRNSKSLITVSLYSHDGDT